MIIRITSSRRLAALEQLDPGKADALLVDVGRGRAVAAGVHPADVHLVRDAAGERQIGGPSAKIGLNTLKSGVCVPPMYESLIR